MTIPPGRFHLPPTIDRNALASAIALASNALSAAAEALAEASKAMSDASKVDRSEAPSGVDSGFVPGAHPLDIAKTGGRPSSSSLDQTHEFGFVNKSTEQQLNKTTDAQLWPGNNLSTPNRVTSPEWNLSDGSDIIPATTPSNSGSGEWTEANNQNWKGQAGQYAHNGQQDEAQYEQGIFFTGPPPAAPAASYGGAGPVPLLGPDNSLGAQSPQYQMGDRGFNAPGSLESKLRNKRNASAGMTSNLHKDPPTSLGVQGLPVGSHHRKYINLARQSDAIAFISFIAQQPGRILCVTPDEATARSSSSDVENLKTVEVYHVYTAKLVQLTRRKLQSCPNAVPPIVVFMPANIYGSSPYKGFSADSVLYWGPPSNTQQYIARSLSLSSPPRLLCVMVIGTQSFDESIHEFSPYPDSVLSAISKFSMKPQSRELREVSPEPVSPKRPASPTNVSNSLRYSSPSQWGTSVALAPRVSLRPIRSPINQRDQHPLPEGHYYIVLNSSEDLSEAADDLDIIPMIAFITLNSKKVICHIPSGRDTTNYQRLVNSIAQVDAIIPKSMKDEHLQVANGILTKKKKTGLLLRGLPKNAPHWNWKSCWRKSHADYFIYCGMPPDLADYLKECRLKVTHSFIVLTVPQFNTFRWQLAAIPQLQPHPSIETFDSSRPGTLLYDLRERLVPLVF